MSMETEVINNPQKKAQLFFYYFEIGFVLKHMFDSQTLLVMNSI